MQKQETWSWLRKICYLILLTALGSAQLANAEESAPEQVLRGRVEDFYSLIQLGRWAQAEAYVSPDSLETFRSGPKNPFLDFQVKSVNLEPDQQSAQVEVQLQVVNPASLGTPLALAQTTHWRLEGGVWRVVLPKPASMASLFNDQGEKKSPPPPEELKFKGHRYGFGKMKPGEIKTAVFPFTNATNHDVTISAVLTGCDCLRAKFNKKTYKPGESGELAIEFDSGHLEQTYEQTIVVKTDPGDLRTLLTVQGYIAPREAPKPVGQPPQAGPASQSNSRSPGQ